MISMAQLTRMLLLAGALTLAGCAKHPDEDHAGHNHGRDAVHPPSTAEGAAVMCGEHNVPEAQCGICRPEAVGALQPGESLQVRLPAAESAEMAGVETACATVGVVADALECYAELAFDQNKLAQIAAPVGGLIYEVTADLGSTLEENAVVARIWSASIAEAVAKAVLTHQTLERERRLRTDRVTPERDLQEAEAVHRAACQQLRTLGFTEEQIDELGATPHESVMLDVRAPFAGEIIERTAVRGALVEPGRTLFTLADRSRMWAMLNIPEVALSRVHIGQTVELRVDSLPGRTFTGTLTWVGAEVDERTRMARARAELPNPDRTLKARMFARARIVTGQRPGALLLPEGAIQRVDRQTLVFVKRAEDLFEARAVRLGVKFNRNWEIAEGLRPDEPVAVMHGFALKSQLLLSRLGAGCADD
jgi:cobalt-zinc-cadmium efflux system membrane fusion protein